jgi:L-aspartate oxidase
LSGVPTFLISEAVRGEGGILRNIHGYRFMPDYAPEKELASRDIVARSIVYEMAKTGADNVFIDVTHLPHNLVTTRFPNIYQFCLDYGLDITKEMVPVAPAAHYFMGGVKVNTWGEQKTAAARRPLKRKRMQMNIICYPQENHAKRCRKSVFPI